MAASASERLDAIRDLLARYAGNTLEEDHTTRDYEDYEDLQLVHLDEAVTLLQGIAEQFAEPATEDTIVAAVMQSLHVTLTLERIEINRNVKLTVADAVRQAVRAGEQSALERWEPDERLPEARTVVDPDVTSWSFTVDGGLAIIWQTDAGEREFVLEGEATRSDLIAALAMVTEPITPFTVLTHDVRTNGATA